MLMTDYSHEALGTDLGVPSGVPPLVFNALCMCEEAGEIAGKIKKIHRDCHGRFNSDDVHALMLECGDLLWYLNRTTENLRARMAAFGPCECTRVGMTNYPFNLLVLNPHTGLEIIARMNIDKLQSRKDRGVIQGSGDGR